MITLASKEYDILVVDVVLVKEISSELVVVVSANDELLVESIAVDELEVD